MFDLVSDLVFDLVFDLDLQLTATMDALETEGTTSGLVQWIVSDVSLNKKPLADTMKGAIYVQPDFTMVDEFFDYFTNSLDENSPPTENPWYKDWFMQTFR